MVNELNLDPNIWKACAGSSVQIPVVGSLVYYFIEGHAEQASSTVDFSSVTCTKSCVLCRIVSVKFLANPDTDEVYSRIRLEPVMEDRSCAAAAAAASMFGLSSQLRLPLRQRVSSNGGVGGGDGDDEIVSFSKILTISDANNGGGFSVPRYCADSIFPPLNYTDEPPVQNISLRDVHGMNWEFRHIYRGTPRRHLLTTGWSKFVNQKKLVAGDSVVFMRNRIGELFVGIRRSSRLSGGSGDSGRWNSQNVRVDVGDGFSRSGRGRVSAESVLEAAELAGQNKPFEIVSYPKAGWSDCVVKAETVENSMAIYWTSGMRIKMAVETEDSCRMTWFQGMISSALMQSSPWRMLQVTWDEPEVLQNVKRVSPWQVELVGTSPSLQSPFHPSKKQRVTQDSGFLTDERGSLFFPMTGLTNSMMEHLSAPLLSYPTFPAGMQGARHDPICVSKLSNHIGNDTHHMVHTEQLSENITPLTLSSGATDLNITDTSLSDNLSANSQVSVHSLGTELRSNKTNNTTTKAGSGTVLLFGKIIHTYQPAEDESNDGNGMKDDNGTGCKETEGVIHSLNPSLSYPCKNACEGLGVQFRRVPSVKQFLS